MHGDETGNHMIYATAWTSFVRVLSRSSISGAHTQPLCLYESKYAPSYRGQAGAQPRLSHV